MSQSVVGEGQNFLAGDYLAAIRDFALSKGVNAKTLLEGSQLSIDVLLNPPQRVGEISMHRVGSNLVNELDDPLTASIEYGRGITLNVHGALGVAVQGAQNLVDAAQLLQQYISTRSNIKEITKVVYDDYISLRMSARTLSAKKVADPVRFFFDFATLINFDTLGRRLLAGYDIDGMSVINIDMPEPENFPYELLKDTIEVRFNQPFFEICVPKEWMFKKLSIDNTELAMAAADKCESELAELDSKDLIKEIRRRIREAQEAKPTLDDMASQLYMSTSTLQRRIKEQHTTYQKIKAEERMVEAKDLLANSDISMEAISERLGFNNASNFTKSFKAWMGVTPKAFRKEHSGI
ncbi:MAG: AraC family transcriptional regulator [Pseudomonadales bacterium]|nr:AraC family transcriptional regulator [Pseudomonadales bacterium]